MCTDSLTKNKKGKNTHSSSHTHRTAKYEIIMFLKFPLYTVNGKVTVTVKIISKSYGNSKKIFTVTAHA